MGLSSLLKESGSHESACARVRMGPSATRKDNSRGTRPLLHNELPSSLRGAVFDTPSSSANRSLRTCKARRYRL